MQRAFQEKRRPHRHTLMYVMNGKHTLSKYVHVQVSASGVFYLIIQILARIETVFQNPRHICACVLRGPSLREVAKSSSPRHVRFRCSAPFVKAMVEHMIHVKRCRIQQTSCDESYDTEEYACFCNVCGHTNHCNMHAEKCEPSSFLRVLFRDPLCLFR